MSEPIAFSPDLQELLASIEECRQSMLNDDIEQSLRLTRHTLDIARKAANPDLISDTLVILAHIQFRLGHYATSSQLCAEVLTLSAEDARSRADALLIMGMCASETHSLEQAEQCYRLANDLSREIGYTQVRARSLHSLAAGVYIIRGQFDLALASDLEALRIYRENNLLQDTWLPLSSIILVYLYQGKQFAARSAQEEHRAVLTQRSLCEGYFWSQEGDLLVAAGDLPAAAAAYQKAYSIGEDIGTPSFQALVRVRLSQYERLNGKPSLARTWAEDSFNAAARVSYQHMQGIALLQRGLAFEACGDLFNAEQDWQTALNLLQPLNAEYELAQLNLHLARIYLQQEQPETHLYAQEAFRLILRGGYWYFARQYLKLLLLLASQNCPDGSSNQDELYSAVLHQISQLPPPPLNIYTLGKFQIWQGFQRVDEHLLRQRRAGELFALLLISPGRQLTFDQISEFLWPERDPESTRTLIHHSCSALKKAIPAPEGCATPYLTVEEGIVTLEIPLDSQIDYLLFEQAFRNEQYLQAVKICQGEFLPEFIYADWSVVLRQRISQKIQQALLSLASSALEEKNYPTALEYYLRILDFEPWSESATLGAMLSYQGLNQIPSALRLYRRVEKTLLDELGIAPNPELQQLRKTLSNRSNSGRSHP